MRSCQHSAWFCQQDTNATTCTQQMERFKACEKELKTKAFSKEGLNAAAKIDPREQEKDELTSWVTDTVEQLNLQVEKFEAEQESLQLALRKSKKSDHSRTERLAQVIHQIERHKFHMTKLEIILRMLENGNLPFEEVCTFRNCASRRALHNRWSS